MSLIDLFNIKFSDWLV